jgi:predicted Zn finger-like uncharacterized protein
MTVQCPHCSTEYLLPDQLLGPRGARVRCPKCSGAFVVLATASGEPRIEVEPTPAASAAPLSAPEESPASNVAPSEGDEAASVAAQVLDELAGKLGDKLQEARAAGKVLSEFGPVMMDAYQEYRRRLGSRASASVFRDALRERWDLDLGTGSDSRQS